MGGSLSCNANIMFCQINTDGWPVVFEEPNREKLSKIFISRKEPNRYILDSSAWSGTLGCCFSRAMSQLVTWRWAEGTGKRSERDPLSANKASDKPWWRSEETRSSLRYPWRDGFSFQQGALVSGITVHPGQCPLLGQVGLQWSVVQWRQSVKTEYQSFLI